MTVQDDFHAIRGGAAIGAVSKRAQLAVVGADRATYLQGLLTNDIPALSPGTGCYAAWLTPQGRMLTDMHVLESGTMILLDVPEESAGATLERLEQFIFSEDVRVESLAGALAPVWVHGPEAASVLERTLAEAAGLGEWPEYRHAQFPFGGGAVSVARIDQIGVPGFCVYAERGREQALVSALEHAGARAVGPDALEAARIEAGYPIYGVDMFDTTIPLEAGIESRAISFSKGCYVGQEIVIRVLHRGGGRVAKKLVRLRIDGDVVPARGSTLLTGERTIGEITSAAHSPALGVIALAYVHRDFTTDGAAVEVQADGRRIHARVGL